MPGLAADLQHAFARLDKEAQQAFDPVIKIPVGLDPVAASRGNGVLLLAPGGAHLIQRLWAAAFDVGDDVSGEHRGSLRARAPKSPHSRPVPALRRAAAPAGNER